MTEDRGGKPPTFEEAKNRRQKARAAGMDPNYWYAVEHASALPPGSVQQVRFWGQDPVALFRDENGRLHAIEDRCAHRQLPLSQGVVQGSRLVCQYHGWEYNGVGELANVPHDLFGKKMPKCNLRSYPVKEKYGLVFMFFGDAERSHEVPMPHIPQLEGDDPWACVPLDFTWSAHHSMIIDNVSDFTHEFLHRKFKPFSESKLTSCETVGDTVFISYDTKVGRGGLSKHFVDQKINTNSMKLAYQYPYQWSNTDEKIRDFCFVLPIDERTTRSFFLFYFDHFVLPFTPIEIPHRLMKPFLEISNKVLIGPLLEEDGRAVEAEQIGYERHWDEPLVELNPAVNAFQALTVRKWEEHLAREQQKKSQRELVRLERRRALEATGAE